jgi:hypothetical protein
MKSVLIEPAKVSKTVVVRVVVDREGKPSEVSYIRGAELFKDAAIESTRKRRFERPGFGPNGLHPNVFCLAVTQH